jgi:hypothetical protein
MLDLTKLLFSGEVGNSSDLPTHQGCRQRDTKFIYW